MAVTSEDVAVKDPKFLTSKITCFGSDFSQFASYEATREVASEVWETRSGSVFTLLSDGYELEITYDHKKRKVSESLVIYNPDKELIEQLVKQRFFGDGAYVSDDEIVVFSNDRAEAHFIKGRDAITSIKVIAPTTNIQKDLLRRLSQKMDEEQVKMLLGV